MNVVKIIEKFLKEKIEAKYTNPPEKIIEIESRELLRDMLEELYMSLGLEEEE